MVDRITHIDHSSPLHGTQQMRDYTRPMCIDDIGSIHIKNVDAAADWIPEVVMVLQEDGFAASAGLRSRFLLLGCDGEVWKCAKDNMQVAFRWIG